jgi:hypothetical protein
MRTHLPRRLAAGTLSLAAIITLITGGARAGVHIDPYAAYRRADPDACATAQPQPGVLRFRAMLIERLGGWGDSIVACSDYEHEEGRAWDWMRDAGDPAEAASVQRLLTWILSTDEHGNRHAMARRLGLAYVIWNDSFLNLSAGASHEWEDYSACTPATTDPGVCHTNHVHFSFAWTGARGETSWHTATYRPGSWYPDGVGDPVPDPIPAFSPQPTPAPATSPSPPPLP